ncbi:MAG: hypothetical protein JWO96_93 [Candidatus Saccharibacteria bacterium]|nr:hypothetical protein [Candidatus Saccharibacteria bacterium]
MLEFLLVLGQIPGTNFQVTFAEVALAVYALLYGFLAIGTWRRRKAFARMNKQYFKLCFLGLRVRWQLRRLGYYSTGVIDSP